VAERFTDYAIMIVDLFLTKTRDSSSHAQHYLQGLLSQIQRKNMQRMGESLRDTKHEDLQHFLTDSPWSTSGVWRWIGQQAQIHLGGERDSMLLVDESAFSKKGRRSVGVARQHNGRLGKTDNCQVGVFAALALGPRATLVGARLFLPDEWVKDPARCRDAGIPEDQIRARTKIELARELIEEAQEHGLEFGWVGIDSFYGRDQDLLCWLEDQPLGFVADTPCDTLVWEQAPSGLKRPESLSAAGAQRVDRVAARWRQAPGTRVTLRSGENGPVQVEVWARRVWVWPGKQKQARQWWLIVRQEPDDQYKYTLCNAPPQTSVERLARLQGERHFIERILEDGKSQLGMAQYQARQWLAWHHHMALVGLAMLFVVKERLLQESGHPLLSTGDVVELLDWYFRGSRTLAEVESVIARRLKRRTRLAATATARAKKKARESSKKIPK
jgi:SRSO17 transposase